MQVELAPDGLAQTLNAGSLRIVYAPAEMAVGRGKDGRRKEDLTSQKWLSKKAQVQRPLTLS